MQIAARAALAVLLIGGSASAASPPPAASAASSPWRAVAPDDLVVIQTRYGRVVIELAPQFAPHAVARIRTLALAHFYDGLSFYRVVDGFVAQGGIGEDGAAAKDHPKEAASLAHWPALPAEFDAPLSQIHAPFVPSKSPDLFAPHVGWSDGFPVGHDETAGRAWIIHCPGTVALARDNGADTATTEFYVVLGEAPRRLDRNLTAFGRVLSGMQYLQKLQRGDAAIDHGVIADPAARDPIVWLRLASDLPPDQRPHAAVMGMPSPAFTQWQAERINPAPEFYVHTPPKVLDVCLAPVPARVSAP